MPTYWRDCLRDLWSAYDGICSYACLYIDPRTGASSADHYVAKSLRLDLAYEWSNYRLACALMNSRKREFEDVLDPFEIKPETFLIEFGTGRLYPNPALDALQIAAVDKTIERLRLNEQLFRDGRIYDFERRQSNDWSIEELKRRSPFVWYEAKRQGLL